MFSWLVSGLDLISDTQKRYRDFFQEDAAEYSGRADLNRSEKQNLRQGESTALITSMDYVAQGKTSSQNFVTVKQWIVSSDEPVFVVSDEAHDSTKESQFAKFFGSDKNGMSDPEIIKRLAGKLFLTATPNEELVKSAHGGAKYVFVKDDEMDPDTKVPEISHLEQLMRGVRKGYLALPLFYVGKEEENVLSDNKDGGVLYTEEQLKYLDGLISKFENV